MSQFSEGFIVGYAGKSVYDNATQKPSKTEGFVFLACAAFFFPGVALWAGLAYMAFGFVDGVEKAKQKQAEDARAAEDARRDRAMLWIEQEIQRLVRDEGYQWDNAVMTAYMECEQRENLPLIERCVTPYFAEDPENKPISI